MRAPALTTLNAQELRCGDADGSGNRGDRELQEPSLFAQLRAEIGVFGGADRVGRDQLIPPIARQHGNHIVGDIERGQDALERVRARDNLPLLNSGQRAPTDSNCVGELLLLVTEVGTLRALYSPYSAVRRSSRNAMKSGGSRVCGGRLEDIAP